MPVQAPALVIDTADWDLAIPVQPAINLAGSRLTAALTPGLGGATIATVSSDDGSIAWDADPVTGLTSALRIAVPLVARGAWRCSRGTPVGADVHRFPPGSTRNEWLGRTTLTVLPASDSLPAQGAGFLYGASNYPSGRPGGRALLPALSVGPQGPRGFQGAPGDAPTAYAIANVASIAIAHGRPYSPDAWVLTPGGEVVEADVFHTPGAVTVAFAVPFTGTLLLR